MITEFVTQNQAAELQKLGYEEPCICVYNGYGQLKSIITSSIDGDYVKKDKWDDRLPAPLKQQAFRFFREKFKLFCEIGWGIHSINTKYGVQYSYTISEEGNFKKDFIDFNEIDSYNNAEEMAIDTLIELAKKGEL